jgi:hypothetical protein
MQKQDYSDLQLRKVKALKRTKVDAEGSPTTKASKMDQDE